MSIRALLLAAAALSCASAQAVIPVQDVSAGVELPPGPKLRSARNSPPQNYWASGRYPSFVILTDAGRVECPRSWYEPSACRAYRPGLDRRPRAFVRKEGAWMICPHPTGRTGCVGIRDLPNFEEQD